MDLTFVLSAAIFTLLALVVATSLLNGSSTAGELFASYFGRAGDDGAAGGLDQPPGPTQNGHLPDNKKKKTQQKEKKAEDDWCEISASSHDHWDVVKSVLSEEAHLHPRTEGQAAPAEQSSSTSSLSVPRPGSRHRSLKADSWSEASSRMSRRPFIGLSDKELLKFAFSYPQTEGAAESPEINDEVESNESLKYVPGKARSHHLQMMMSSDELEEERRVQHEQLAAIFQLLKDNQETFGDVSDGEMEEQLRLYSI